MAVFPVFFNFSECLPKACSETKLEKLKKLEKLLSQESLGKSSFSSFFRFAECLPKACSETKLEKLLSQEKLGCLPSL